MAWQLSPSVTLREERHFGDRVVRCFAERPRVKELMLSRRGGIAILAPELQTALEIRFPDRYLWSDGYTILALWLDIPRLLSCDIFAPEIETEEYDEGEQIIEANSLERVIKLLKELR